MSVLRGDRATPAETVVHANLDGMLVVPEARTDNRSRPGGEGGVAEIVILVFGLGRPVRREHVFEAGADGVAVLVGAIGGKRRGHAGDGDADIGIVAPGIAALGVEQCRTPGVADPAGHRAELVVLGGHYRATRESQVTVVVGEPAV